MTDGGVRYGPGQDRERERDVRSRNAASDVAADLLPPDSPSCVRPNDERHRATDWRLVAIEEGEHARPAGGWVCGLCHPPVRADIEGRP